MANAETPVDADYIHASTAKNEGEMLQIELYVSDVDKTRVVFDNVFGMVLIEEKPGWLHLRLRKNFDIMLFSPEQNLSAESHWPLPSPGSGGKGIEIVICTSDVPAKLDAVRQLGYQCTDLRYTPWGSIEFIFHLEEGYLIRVKQLPVLRTDKQ